MFAYRRTPPYPNCKEFVPRISLMLKKRYDIFFSIKDIKGIKDNIVGQLTLDKNKYFISLYVCTVYIHCTIQYQILA